MVNLSHEFRGSFESSSDAFVFDDERWLTSPSDLSSAFSDWTTISSDLPCRGREHDVQAVEETMENSSDVDVLQGPEIAPAQPIDIPGKSPTHVGTGRSHPFSGEDNKPLFFRQPTRPNLHHQKPSLITYLLATSSAPMSPLLTSPPSNSSNSSDGPVTPADSFEYFWDDELASKSPRMEEFWHSGEVNQIEQSLNMIWPGEDC